MSSDAPYNFHHLSSNTFHFFNNKTTKEFLTKWSMIDGMQIQAYSFDRVFKIYSQKDFVQDFFANQTVISTLQRATEHHSFVPLGIPGETVQMKEIRCTQTSMTFFDRLTGTVAREGSGAVKKCLPEYYKSYTEDGNEQNQIEVSDELRKMLIFPEDSDDGELFSVDEKHEFIFRLFQHFVIGGSLCQFEDYLNSYLDLTKGFYKELVSVTRNQNSNGNDQEYDIATNAIVVQIFSVTCDSFQPGKNLLFSTNQYNNFFYMIIDPMRRLCYTLYHQV